MVKKAALAIGAVRTSWTRRTWKREIAAMLLVLWAAMTVYLTWWCPEARINVVLSVYVTATTFIGSFAVAAFGLDALVKQGIPTTTGVK